MSPRRDHRFAVYDLGAPRMPRTSRHRLGDRKYVDTAIEDEMASGPPQSKLPTMLGSRDEARRSDRGGLAGREIVMNRRRCACPRRVGPLVLDEGLQETHEVIGSRSIIQHLLASRAHARLPAPRFAATTSTPLVSGIRITDAGGHRTIRHSRRTATTIEDVPSTRRCAFGFRRSCAGGLCAAEASPRQ